MDKYDEIKCIGCGAFGEAHLVALRNTNEMYVVKKIKTQLLTDKEKAQAFAEVELLAKLRHPNVVEYRESFVERDVIHIVMAYCDGGDLADAIRKRATTGASFTTSQILDWFVQMAMAIKYLHQQRILHRDLKTSNIFLTTDNVIKLGDFGIAKTLDATLDQAKTVVGTPYYMSPEVCESKPYSYASDVWSLGCVLYEMCALRRAFEAPNILSLILTIVRNECAPLPAHFDSEISMLIKRLLDKAPERRPSMDEIFTIPYIRNHMQGLVASGGSLRVNAAARRPLGAPKRRVHAKNLGARRPSSIENGSSSKRKPAPTAANRNATQWLPITPVDADDMRQNERHDDLELLDTSIDDETQLDVRAPERSRTPEPLMYDAVIDDVIIQPPPAPVAALQQQLVRAWTGDDDDDVINDDNDVINDGFDASALRAHDAAAELMHPNFATAYSAECVDSLQIVYSNSSTSATAKGRRRQRGRFAHELSSPTTRAVVDDTTLCLAETDASSSSPTTRDCVVMKRFPLHVDASIDYLDDDDTNAQLFVHYTRRTSAQDDDDDDDDDVNDALQLEDASFDMDAIGSAVGSYMLPGLDGVDHASANGDPDAYLSEEDDSNASDGDDYTSLSEYEAEENFYSDDSDFYDDDDVNDDVHDVAPNASTTLQYSDDFDDADAEVIEYANDAFVTDDNNSSDDDKDGDDDDVSNDSVALDLLPRTTTAAATARPASSLSPTSSKKQQRSPPTEVQWVMRNVAESLLQSHDDVAVA